MIEQLKILENHYGHPSKVAPALGIGNRQYRRIKKSGKSTDTIKILISELVLKIQELEQKHDQRN